MDYTGRRPLDRAAKSSVSSIVQYLRGALAPERRKMILPVLMCMFLIITVCLMSLFRAQGLDRQVSNLTDSFTDTSRANIEYEYFNESIDVPESERAARIGERATRSANQYESIVFSADPVTKAPFLVGATYSADAFPLLPGQPSIFSYFGDFNGIPLTDYTIFPRSKGYVVSEDLVGALAETTYRNRRYAEISRKIESNPENWTLQKFRSKTEQIDSVTYPDREITQYVAESDLMLSVDPSVTGPTLPVTGRIDVLAPLETGVKEVRFYHFIPSFVATFVLYYVINALVVSGFRDFKQDVEHWSLRKDFFINNVIGSALISVGVVSLWIYATFSPNTSLVSEVSQLLGSAVLWTGVFATVVNELRKLTRYAWIISGLSMSAILASVVGPSRFESFVFATFVSGATVVYPLILGVVSEYGRIHGEHFLERSTREKEDKDVEK